MIIIIIIIIIQLITTGIIDCKCMNALISLENLLEKIFGKQQMILTSYDIPIAFSSACTRLVQEYSRSEEGGFTWYFVW